jgi:hypothetical protein
MRVIYRKGDDAMSQQPIPEPQQQAQKSRQHSSDDYAQKSYRPGKHQASSMPKSEHPSTYDDSIPSYSYHAQDGTTFTQPTRAESTGQQEQSSQRRSSNFAGTSFENNSRPYSQYKTQQQTPLWVWPRFKGRNIVKVLLLLTLAGILLTAVVTVIFILAVSLIVPLIIAFYIAVLYFAIRFVRFMRGTTRTRGRYGRHRSWH